MLLLHLALLQSLAHPYLIEDWYQNLSHFGPLDRDYDAGWDFHPMQLVDDFTFRLDNVAGSPEHPFMFVSPTGTPTPPLGLYNWKQGKIGIGTNGTTIPGGGAGRYPYKGVFNLTLYTDGHPSKPRTYTLVPVKGKLRYPSVRVTSAKQVVPVGVVTNVRLHFNEIVRLSEQLVVSVEGCGVRWLGSAWAQEEGYVFSRRISAPTSHGTVRIFAPQGTGISRFTGLNSTSGSLTILVPQAMTTSALWGPLVELRDNSRVHRDSDSHDGDWYVTPIHMVYIPSERSVLVSGWLRRDGLPCYGGKGAGGRRKASVTFKVKVATLDALTTPVMQVDRVEENALISFEEPQNKTYFSHPVDGDAIYCAGHTPLEDGNIFYFGGARYAYTSWGQEHEWGIDYARIYNIKSSSFTKVNARAPLGRAWYPTASRLHDGRVMVTGGFIDYSSESCYAVGTFWRDGLKSCLNPQINIFDPQKHDKGEDPWSVYLDDAHMDHAIDPGIREYTRVFTLPQPVQHEGNTYDVLVLGKSGEVCLLNMDPNTPMKDRLYKPPNGARPGCGVRGQASDQSTAVPLTTNGGALFVMGGCTSDPETMQSADVYHVHNDSWTRTATGIMRGVPASILLPDGRILLLSGENDGVDQNYFATTRPENLDDMWGPSDPRIVQIFDPDTQTVTTEWTEETDVFRGYHNTASLLDDGRVLVGGGFNQLGDVGCENPNLRVFSPSYLKNGPRPVIVREEGHNGSLQLKLGQKSLVIRHNGQAQIHPTKGVALVAVQAFTHSYGQNQRHVRLKTQKIESGRVVVDVPESSRLLLPGHYHLFLISKDGVPSVSLHVIVVRSFGSPYVAPLVWPWVLMSVAIVIFLVFLGACVFCWWRKRAWKAEIRGDYLLNDLQT